MDDTEARDLETLTPKMPTKIGGFALAITGIFTVVMAAQTYAVWIMRSWHIAVPLVMLALGVSGVFLGMKVATLRGWASIAGTAVAALSTLVFGAWGAYGFLHGFISLLGLAIVPMSAIACALSATTISAGIRADDARERLHKSGLRLGF
jgi:hypothetical protein